MLCCAAAVAILVAQLLEYGALQFLIDACFTYYQEDSVAPNISMLLRVIVTNGVYSRFCAH